VNKPFGFTNSYSMLFLAEIWKSLPTSVFFLAGSCFLSNGSLIVKSSLKERWFSGLEIDINLFPYFLSIFLKYYS
jgi:hypothetical protein